MGRNLGTFSFHFSVVVFIQQMPDAYKRDVVGKRNKQAFGANDKVTTEI